LKALLCSKLSFERNADKSTDISEMPATVLLR